MSKEKQTEERNELVELLEDIECDWDAYIDECQENEELPEISYYFFHADAVLRAGFRKQNEGERLTTDGGLPLCSNCETCISILQGIADFDFCPHCGAKMKGE